MHPPVRLADIVWSLAVWSSPDAFPASDLQSHRAEAKQLISLVQPNGANKMRTKPMGPDGTDGTVNLPVNSAFSLENAAILAILI